MTMEFPPTIAEQFAELRTSIEEQYDPQAYATWTATRQLGHTENLLRLHGCRRNTSIKTESL